MKARRLRSGLGTPAVLGALAGMILTPGLAAAAGDAAATGDAAPAQPAARVEARSADLLAVGIVHDDRMIIHLSRTTDNAPVRDAALNVLLRGVVHPTSSLADGGYMLRSKDLTLPGAAALVFQLAQPGTPPGTHEDIRGTLDIAGPLPKEEDKNSARQLGWWALNFAVCIGFLMLLSRRRKAAAAAGD